AKMFGSEAIRQSIPDIFQELVQNYGDLLDLALEEQAYKVEHNLSERLRSLADKLGFLKASPRDVVDIHTTTLRKKNQDVTLAKAQAYVSEGRLMVLELMGYLVSFYRKYYIGLSNIKLFNNTQS
ncbi:MAG: response regulator, partial [Microcystis sp.]